MILLENSRKGVQIHSAFLLTGAQRPGLGDAHSFLDYESLGSAFHKALGSQIEIH
ncbi:hypothetical protein VAEU17_4310115 [Vibrio aestuarianus]|nr:hypothetical protein VAEU17_4310115 [Vibrio aestuarianus]